MRAPRDLTGLIKFLARDDWKSRLEDVMGEHFGPAMEAFDLKYDEIGAALGGGWDMTLWGMAFEDFLGREFEPDGRNFVEEYLRRRGCAGQGLHARSAQLDAKPLRGQRHRFRGIVSCARPDPRR